MLKRFEELEYKLPIPILLEYNYAAIQQLDFTLNSKTFAAEQHNRILFDSLKLSFNVGRRFSFATKDFIQYRYINTNLNLYWMYQDTLSNRGVYFDKIKGLLAFANNLHGQKKLNTNLERHVKYINQALYPTMGISSMVIQNKFEECFDVICDTYKGPARDLLLSRLMYQAYAIGYDVPKEYEKKYRANSINKEYRRVIARSKKAYLKTISEKQEFL